MYNIDIFATYVCRYAVCVLVRIFLERVNEKLGMEGI